jgi:hypothetical protein
MAQSISKRHLARRTFLRGTGVALALPWLDAMLPACATQAQAAAAVKPPKRFIGINYEFGFHGPHLFPKEAGTDYVATPYLEALAEHRSDFSVISGLSHPEQNGVNGHAGEMTIFTTAKHPGLPGFKNTISFDQYLVEKLAPDTRFPSLVLSLDSKVSISWSASGVNVPAEVSPEKLYQQLFVTGTPASVALQMSELKRGRSILDSLIERARKMHASLGGRDREKLDQYLTSVRELELRLAALEQWNKKPKPTVDAAAPKDVADKSDILALTRLMHEMLVLALQTDSTRIATVRAAYAPVPNIDGIDTGWHDLTHHGQSHEKIDLLKKIELAEFDEINHLLKLLKQAQDADGSVLDNTHLLIVSNLGNASAHSWRDLPVLVAGGGFQHGRHVRGGGAGLENKYLANLFVQVAQRMGVETDAFGSSNGTSIEGMV